MRGTWQWRRFINADVLFIAGDDVLNAVNLYAYCNGNPVILVDPSGMSVVEVIDVVCRNLFSTIAIIFELTFDSTEGLVELPLYYSSAAAVATPLLVSLGSAGATGLSLSWNPVGWIIITGVGVAAIGVGVYYGVEAYQEYQKNLDKTVEEILKTKKGSIKRAPLEPGSPSWDDIAKLTLAEIKRRKENGEVGYKTFYKLLTQGEYNIGR